ncbi:MAG: hypothetical protein D3922_14295, partial [Candidatus Electrothrix sp. AR1]|nr:hypothetical protein [Candidatus Electrothrix sp. AR1]
MEQEDGDYSEERGNIMKRNIARQQKKKILAALCLVSLMLTAPEARSEKVVVIPLGSKTVIEASIYWAGEWGENLLYKPGDGIQHEGSSYLCRKNHTSSQAS